MSSHFTLPETLPGAAPDAGTVQRAADALLARRPELSTVIAPLAALAVASHRAAALLEGWQPASLPPIAPDKLAQGVPWLAGDDLAWLAGQDRAVAAEVLPEIARQFPAVAGECEKILVAANAGRLDTPRLVRKLLDNDAAGLAEIADALDVRPGLLGLAAREIALPLLRRAASLAAARLAETQWSRGCCPCCGSLPSAAFLARRDERNAEYLVGGGGQRVLLCSRCEHRWNAKRIMCAVCENEDPHGMERITVDKQPGERVHLCTNCNSYLPCLDLREALDVTTLEIEPLGLLHLDIIARERGFSPAAATPWNALGDTR